MVDMVTTVPSMPMMGETVLGTRFDVGFGGKGANQAVMAARSGARVGMVACVGGDDYGTRTLDNFTKHGVDARFVRVAPEHVTGVAPITVDEQGRNTVIIVPAANTALSTADVSAAFAAGTSATVVVSQLEIDPGVVAHAFEAAKNLGATTILNPAPVKPLDRDLLDLSDFLVPNELELAGLLGWSEARAGTIETLGFEAINELALGLRTRDNQHVIATLGRRGALLASPSNPIIVEAPEVRAADSTGAGDAFVGTFAAHLATDDDVVRAIQRAVAAASHSVTHRGTQTSYPDAATLGALREARAVRLDSTAMS